MSNYLTWESNLKRMTTGTTTNCKDYNDSLFTIQKKNKVLFVKFAESGIFGWYLGLFFLKKWSFLGFVWFGAILDEPNCAMSVQNGACACDGAFLFFINFFFFFIYFFLLLVTSVDWWWLAERQCEEVWNSIVDTSTTWGCRGAILKARLIRNGLDYVALCQSANRFILTLHISWQNLASKNMFVQTVFIQFNSMSPILSDTESNKEIYLIQIYFDGLAVHKVKVIVAYEVVHCPRH